MNKMVNNTNRPCYTFFKAEIWTKTLMCTNGSHFKRVFSFYGQSAINMYMLCIHTWYITEQVTSIMNALLNSKYRGQFKNRLCYVNNLFHICEHWYTVRHNCTVYANLFRIAHMTQDMVQCLNMYHGTYCATLTHTMNQSEFVCTNVV